MDARPLVAAKTGIGHYVYNVLEQLAEIDSDNEYFLYSNLPVPGELPAFYRCVRSAGSARSHLWMQSRLPFWLIEDKIDLFWGGGYAAPLMTPLLRRWKTVVTVHDLVYRHYPETMPWVRSAHMRWGLPLYMGAADRVIADSLNTANDIAAFHRRLFKKVTVIPLAAGRQYFASLPADEVRTVLSRYGLSAGYLLFVGTIEPRKGVDTILRAMALLQQRGGPVPPIVLVGKAGWKTEGIMALPAQLAIQPLVRFLDYVADEDLPALYQGASLFLYPSFYEGFGLPVLEAMASGTPVITSRSSSLPEVAGEAAVYVDAGDVTGLAGAMGECLAKEELRQQLRQRGLEQAKRFSWRRTAQQTLQVFEQCQHDQGAEF